MAERSPLTSGSSGELGCLSEYSDFLRPVQSRTKLGKFVILPLFAFEMRDLVKTVHGRHYDDHEKMMTMVIIWSSF